MEDIGDIYKQHKNQKFSKLRQINIFGDLVMK